MLIFWGTPLIDDPREHKLDNQSYEIVNQIDADRTHGASQLAVLALEGLQTFAEAWQGDNVEEFYGDLLFLIDELISVRPSIIAIANLVNAFQHQLQPASKDKLSEIRDSVINIAGQLKQDTQHASEQTAIEVAELINENEVLMTHSLSSMVKRVFTLVRDRSVKAIVTESRPGNEGLLLAEFLSSLEIETCYITDAQIGLWVPKADKIIIGADSILSDGSVVNKSGTSLLALAARESDIPVYVCCESFKWADVNGDQIELEEMDPEELRLPPMEYVVARNIYFDITPAELVTGWVSESGVEYQWL